MTVRLLGQYSIYAPNTIVSLDAATEAGLLAAGQASATLTGGVPYLPVLSANDNNAFRIVATPCRYPSIMGSLKQVYDVLLCQATEDLHELQIFWANYGALAEALSNVGTLSVMAAIEFPLGSDRYQLLSFNRNTIGTVPGGADLAADALKLTTMIPEGSNFKLYQWAASPTAIPLCCNSAAPATFSNANGFLVQSGTGGTSINNLQLVNTSAARNSAAATDNTSTLYFGPTAMVARSNRRAFAFVTDSRGAGQNFGGPYLYDYADTAAGLSGVCERLFGGQGYGWINLGVASDSLAIFLGTVPATGGGGRRISYMRFATDIVNANGVNGLGAGTAAVLAMEDSFFKLDAIVGKRKWTMTVPPNATVSTDLYITAAGQTVATTDATRQALNAQRLSDVRYDGGCLDVASVVEDPANPGKWRCGVGARVSVVAMTAGSNVITGAGFTPIDTGFDVVIPGAGGTVATPASLRAMAVYVSPNQLNLVNRISGAVVNAVNAVAAASATVQAGVYTGDGIHETQYASKQEQAALAPVVAALIAKRGRTTMLV